MDSTLGSLKDGVQFLACKVKGSAIQYSPSFSRFLSGVQGFCNGIRWTFVQSINWTIRRHGRRNRGLPLPLPSPWPPSTTKGMDTLGKVVELLDDVSSRLMCRLHDVHKNLKFWKARAKGDDGPKVRFMVFERGPYAFFQGAAKLLRDFVWERSPSHELVMAAISQISERVILLSTLECRLATVLGEVHTAADRFGENVMKDQIMEACLVLISVHKAIVALEGSYNLPQRDYCSRELVKVDTSVVHLHFKDLPEDILDRKDWTDTEIVICVGVIQENMKLLEDCLCTLMQEYRKPKRASRLWLRYTGSTVGLALLSGWLAQHSRLMGSRDLETWLMQGCEAVVAFMKEHVEQPVLSIKDDLFETFRRRHRGAAELDDVQLTADSLHRMLLAFAAQSKGQEVSNIATEQEMLEIVMNRYEKEITHPLQNLIGGELLRAMLIQVQKLKLDIETAMLELNQILRANEINFAVLAALPALLLAFILGWLLRISLSQSKGAEGRGRAARVRRRMLLAEVEKILVMCRIKVDEGQEKEILPLYGMIIYLLDQFYKAVEHHAISSGEWSSLHGDILDLAKPKIAPVQKLAIASRMERIYECIIPRRPS